MDLSKRHATAIFASLFVIAIAGGLIATMTSHWTLGVVIACVAGFPAFLVGYIATDRQSPFADAGTSTFGDTPGHGGHGGGHGG